MHGKNPKTDGSLSKRIVRAGWMIAGFLALACALIGVFLPVLPTTPFVLLAAYAFTRCSPRLRNWLEKHRLFGPMIADWEANGAIARRYKILACSIMVAALVGSFFAGVSKPVLIVQILVMAVAAIYVLTRPNAIGDA